MTIDTLERLHYQLQKDKQSNPKQSLFLLLDNQPQTELISHYFSLDEAPEYRPLFLGTHLEEHIQHSPYIVQATSSTQAFIDWFFTNSQQWGFLYFSSHSIDDALDHWQKNTLSNTTVNTNQQVLLRIYDAKVLSTIIDNPYYSEFQQALSPCSTLYYQNNNNQWIRQKTNQLIMNQRTTPTDVAAGSEHEHQQTQHSSFINALENDQLHTLCTPVIAKRCELLFWDKKPHLIEKFYPPIRKNVMEQGVEFARQANLMEPRYLFSFLALWLERGPKAITTQNGRSQLMSTAISSDEKICLLKEICGIEDSWNQVESTVFNR